MHLFSQQTLPKFPSSTVGQAKFINMVNRRLDITAGVTELTLQPFSVRPSDFPTLPQTQHVEGVVATRLTPPCRAATTT